MFRLFYVNLHIYANFKHTISTTPYKMNKSILATITAAAILQTANAEQISPQQALARVNTEKTAVGIIKNNDVTLAYTAESEKSGIETFYVFNKNNDNGYIILSANDQTEPILGYTTTGQFDYANMPPAMKWWLKSYQEQIEYAATHKSRQIVISKTEASTEQKKEIASLIKTTWNQGAPYNNQCPILKGRQAPTGCVATAMAQVMRYHQWPEKGQGSNQYNYQYSYIENNIQQTGLASEAMDFSKVSFNWDLMQNTYNSSSNSQQIDAVATLMHACGVSVNMGYGQKESGAVSSNLPKAYLNFFNYDSSVYYRQRDYYTSVEWEDIIYNELANGRPVQYSGHGDGGGHSFVCDGYDGNGYFHINWGWGGSSDGYFKLSALDPDALGIGGGTGGFNFSQGAVINIQKPQAISSVIIEIMSNGGLSAVEGTRSRNENIQYFPNPNGKVTGGTVFYNNSTATLTSKCYIGTKLVNTTTNETTYQQGLSLNGLKPNYGYSSLTVYGSRITQKGTYKVSPVFSLDGGATWHNVLIPKTAPQYILLNVTDSEINVSVPSTEAELSAKLTVPDEVLTNGVYTITGEISNTGSYFYGPVYGAFLNYNPASNAASLAAMAGNVFAEIDQNETTNVDIEIQAQNISEGNYYFAYLVEGAGNSAVIISELYPVKVTKSGKLSVTLSAANINEGRIPMNNMVFNGTATATGGSFHGAISLYIFENFDDDNDGSVNHVGVINTDILNISSGETVNFTASGSITEGQIGREYSARPYYNNNRIGNTKVFFILGDEESGIENVYGNCGTKLHVTPNPASDAATITANAAIKAVNIYSMQGTQVMTEKFDGLDTSVIINVSRLSGGHYIMQAVTANGQAVTRLIIK